jgi:Homing endonuclease associated repeat
MNSKETAKKEWSKEAVLDAIRECAEKVGHPPSLAELRLHQGVEERHVRKHFLRYQRALAECGMMREGAGYRVPLEALFKDWADLTRRLGKVPNINEYDMYSRYSHRPLVNRFGNWRQVPMGMLGLAEENGWEVEWKDVVDVAREHLRRAGEPARTSKRHSTPNELGLFPDRPTYGPPVIRVPLAHGPANEAGVMLLFGAMAAGLGFVVTRVQTEFPDCEAMREMQPDVWQRVRIEFEYESRNFVRHLHNTQDCDVIVCWVHNWPECPLQVVELREKIADIAVIATK